MPNALQKLFVGPPDGSSDFSDINCLAVIVRALDAHFNRDEQKEMDAFGDPFLMYAISDWDDKDEARPRLVEHLLGSGVLSDHKHPEPYTKLSESGSMLSSIWSTSFNKLFDIYIKKTSQPNSKWKEFRPKDPKRAPFASLVHINDRDEEYKDATNLSDAIQRAFDRKLDRDGGGWDYARVSKQPTVLRVHFTPSRRSWTIDELETISFEEQNLYGKLRTWRSYNLIGVVRMAATTADPSFVRLFREDGHEVEVIASGSNDEKKSTYLSQNWRIGEEGHTYMLYYLYSEPKFRKVGEATDAIWSMDRVAAERAAHEQ
ncbi:hypothetical protein ACHAQH_010056, partial [Verticillium albo-atrum]